MAVLDTIATVAHVGFASLWTGSVVFGALLAGNLSRRSSDALVELVLDKLRFVSRTSAVVTLLTGGYMAVGYSHAYFTSSTSGLLLSAMVVLWVLLITSVEIGAARILDGAENGVAIMGLAGVVAVALLVDVGLLAAGL